MKVSGSLLSSVSLMIPFDHERFPKCRKSFPEYEECVS